MKKLVLTSIFMIVMMGMPAMIQATDINIGNVYIPRPFIHAAKDFAKGYYKVVLTEKDGIPYFSVSKKNELLFEELAVIKANDQQAKKFKYKIRKEMLNGNEYYRIRVIEPDKLIMAFFLLKNNENAPVLPATPEPPPPVPTPTEETNE